MFYPPFPLLLVLPPEITITSDPPRGVPIAGTMYSLKCEVEVYEELLSPLEIRWIDPNGKNVGKYKH